MSASILTAENGEFPVSNELRELICYTSDGRLYISKSHTQDPHVRGFRARLQRMGRSVEVFPVDMSVISDLYASAKSGGRGGERDDSDTQRMAKTLFDKAVSLRASDIHIRVSKKDKTRFFFRIHNDLEFQGEESYEIGVSLCSTIYQAMSDVSDATFEMMSRQDARISDKSKLPNGIDGIRIATSPQVDGQIMVLRLLYNDASESTDIEALGYTESNSSNLTLMRHKPSGINLIGGPTGSGKSTTLQRLLVSQIKESEGKKHIITVEDPPEYPIPGTVQTPVTNADSEEDRARAFQNAIKSAMRLDPDVIMIGEVRDGASARLAVQAAMTGHQVWTTVHANSAISIIDRLIDLGIQIELMTDPTIISGLVCQRLVQVLCEHCKIPIIDAAHRYSPRDMERMMGAITLDGTYVKGDGCEKCRNSGIAGRTVVSETIVPNQKFMSYIRRGDRVGAIGHWKTQMGGKDMLSDAIAKVATGTVDPFSAEDVVGPLNAEKIEVDSHD